MLDLMVGLRKSQHTSHEKGGKEGKASSEMPRAQTPRPILGQFFPPQVAIGVSNKRSVNGDPSEPDSKRKRLYD